MQRHRDPLMGKVYLNRLELLRLIERVPDDDHLRLILTKALDRINARVSEPEKIAN